MPPVPASKGQVYELVRKLYFFHNRKVDEVHSGHPAPSLVPGMEIGVLTLACPAHSDVQ